MIFFVLFGDLPIIHTISASVPCASHRSTNGSPTLTYVFSGSGSKNTLAANKKKVKELLI